MGAEAREGGRNELDAQYYPAMYQVCARRRYGAAGGLSTDASCEADAAAANMGTWRKKAARPTRDGAHIHCFHLLPYSSPCKSATNPAQAYAGSSPAVSTTASTLLPPASADSARQSCGFAPGLVAPHGATAHHRAGAYRPPARRFLPVRGHDPRARGPSVSPTAAARLSRISVCRRPAIKGGLFRGRWFGVLLRISTRRGFDSRAPVKIIGRVYAV